MTVGVDEVERVAVIGAGLMGHGIALEFALAGYAVTLHDVDERRLADAIGRMRASLRLLSDAGLAAAQVDAVPAALRITTDLAGAVAGADLVVEAVYEHLPLKHEIFRELDRHAPPRAILASNTSTFVPSVLAEATTRPERVLVAHYFNPPHLIPLVEVVPGARTAEETVQTMVALLTRVGKEAVVVRHEAPGFIANRLQNALRREALSSVARGAATPQDVDRGGRRGFGRRLAVAGPFELTELIGLDLALAIAEQLYPTLESSPEPPAILRDKVARGELGVKTGQGFYGWTPEEAAALRERVVRALIAIARLSADADPA